MLIDYDKAGVTASSQTSLTYGLNINMADAATNNASGLVSMIGAQIDIDSANAQGSINQRGLVMNVAADGVGDSSLSTTTGVVGIDITCMDGGNDIVLRSQDQLKDYCSISTTTNGATTILTDDYSHALAHFEITADGNITLDAAGDIALECGGGDLTCDGLITATHASGVIVNDATASSATEGGNLVLASDDGAVMGSGHR